MSAVHYPEARPIAGAPATPIRYVAACSCGWAAGVTHTRKRDAVPAAIAHAREHNQRPQEEPHHAR